MEIISKLRKELSLNWRGYLMAIGLVAMATWLKYLAQPYIIAANIPILYMLAIVPTAVFFGLGPSILVCILSVLAYDFFFIPPIYQITFNVSEVPILVIFLLVGLVMSFLASNLREKNRMAVAEITTRKQTEAELEKYRDHLEDLVTQRTSELETANSDLNREIDDRKRIEEALRESEERWATTVGSIGDAVIATDTDGRVTFVNAVAETLTGWTLREAKNQPVETVFNIINEHTRQKVTSPVEKVLQQGIICDLANHTILIRKDGMEVAIDDSGAPIKTRDGNIIGVVLVFRDITERKKAEEAIRASEERFKAIADNTPDHILVQDAGLRYTFVVNPQVGLTEQGMLGKTDYDILAKEDAEKLTQMKRQVIATGKPFHLETSLVNKEGKLEYFSGSYVPKFNREGQTDGLIGYFRNITERKKAEEALRKSEERWNAAIENFTEGAIIATEDEQMIYWNPAARRMHGFKTSEEGIGPLKETPNTFQLWTADSSHLLELEEWPMKSIKRGEIVRNLELRLRRPDQGWEKIVSYSGVMVDTPVGERLIFLSVFDLTELRKAEEELKRYTRDLEAANKELEAFSYSISHDLRAPLRTLDGFSEIVLEDYGNRLDDTGKEYLNKIRNASQNMSELIEAILKLTRISRSEMHQDEVDLSDLAKSIAEGLKQSQLERQVEFLIESGLIVKGDTALLRIALNNLLENAWKYTGKFPVARIEVRSLIQNGEKVFFIKDNGIGFDMQYKDKLFQPFQRLHTSNEFQGTGIGLATVQRVIKRHNGNIWAESEVGKGTTFFFTLG